MMLIHQVSRPQTAFQQPVDESELRSCLQRQLPGEPILAVSELDAGLFNNTFRVDTADRAYILKVAPAADAAVFYNERRLMQRERRISAHLRSASSLVPKYLSFFSVDGRQALLQPFVDGRLWGEEIARLSESENCLLWQQLGEFAATVHACRGTGFGYPGHEFTRWSRFIVDNVEGMVEDCRQQAVLGVEIEQYLALLPHFLPALDRIETPALLHGDLWPSNVIFDGTGADIHLEAVIDGERAFWGDPVCDWVLILYGVPDAFWQGYGENLLLTREPACIAVYRGMYFILNILEAIRFDESDAPVRQRLAAVNDELERLQSA